MLLNLEQSEYRRFDDLDVNDSFSMSECGQFAKANDTMAINSGTGEWIEVDPERLVYHFPEGLPGVRDMPGGYWHPEPED